MILSVDDVNGKNIQIEPSAFADVESAILGLDGKSSTQVGLFIDDETYVQIGGGKDLYTCAIRANGKLHILFDPKTSSDEYVWLVSGQGDEVPRNQCFCANDVIRVAKLFWNERTLSEEYAWKTF